MYFDPRVIDGFWKRVTVTDDDCWQWRGQTLPAGYGLFTLRFDGRVKHFYGHRVSYAIHSGSPIPAGMVVMHTCDNPPCCNPTHLRLGTQQDNMRDAKKKGRTRGGTRGERVGSAKLTEASVRDIRRRRADGEPLLTIASDYGVTKNCVSRIALRKTWAHLD